MRKRLLILGAVLFSSIKFSSAQITFQKTFGGPNDDSGNSVQQTSDGGYIITGYTNGSTMVTRDVYLIKTDLNGDPLWTKTFGGTSDDGGNSVQPTTDGGYIITGWTTSFGSGFWDVYLIKTDANGNSLWTKTFGGPDDDRGNYVQQTTDGGYIITGYTTSFGAGNNDLYLIKTDVNGDSLWTKTFGGSDHDYGFSIQQTTDGGYIITGRTLGSGANLIKVDVNGNLLWVKSFGGINDDYCYSVKQTTDGGYVIAGGTTSFGAGYYDVYLIKTDASGDTLWTKTIGSTVYEESYSVRQTTDGGYIIAGYTDSLSWGSADVYLIKTDVNGNLLWTKTFGGTGDDRGFSAQQTMDGGYIITGWTTSFGAGSYDVYIIKTDANGNSGCSQGNPTTIISPTTTQVSTPATIVSSGGIVGTPPTIVGSGGNVTTLCTTVGVNEILNQEELVLFPNPFSDKLNITTERNELVEVIFYDITSRKLLQQTFTNSVTLNTAQLAKGMYLYEVRNKNGVIKKGKVIHR